MKGILCCFQGTHVDGQAHAGEATDPPRPVASTKEPLQHQQLQPSHGLQAAGEGSQRGKRVAFVGIPSDDGLGEARRSV
jgi:hypothetical protein